MLEILTHSLILDIVNIRKNQFLTVGNELNFLILENGFPVSEIKFIIRKSFSNIRNYASNFQHYISYKYKKIIRNIKKLKLIF